VTFDEFRMWFAEYCQLSPRTPAWMRDAAQRASEAGVALSPDQVVRGWYRSLERRAAWAVKRATARLAESGALSRLHPEQHLGAIIGEAIQIERDEGFGKAADPQWDEYTCEICGGVGLVVIDTPYPDGRPHESTVACICERGARPPVRGMRRLRPGDVFAGSGGRRYEA